MRWQISKDLAWRELDDEIVVRSESTGATHLLESLTAELLHTLARTRTPLTVQELAGRLAEEGEAPGELSKSIEATLSELHRLGLVEPSG